MSRRKPAKICPGCGTPLLTALSKRLGQCSGCTAQQAEHLRELGKPVKPLRRI
jgi:hypothetical protein